MICLSIVAGGGGGVLAALLWGGVISSMQDAHLEQILSNPNPDPAVYADYYSTISSVPLIVIYAVLGLLTAISFDILTEKAKAEHRSGTFVVLGTTLVANLYFAGLTMLVSYLNHHIYFGFVSVPPIGLTHMLLINGRHVLITFAVTMILSWLLMPVYRRLIPKRIYIQNLKSIFHRWIFILILVMGGLLISVTYIRLSVQAKNSAYKLLMDKMTFIENRAENNLTEEYLIDLVNDFSIGRDGYTMLVKDGVIIAPDDKEVLGRSITDMGFEPSSYQSGDCFYETLDGQGIYGGYLTSRGYQFLIIYPEHEMYAERNAVINGSILIYILILSALYIQIFWLLKNKVFQPMGTIQKTLEEISDGHLDARVHLTGVDEFEEMSDHVNDTVVKLEELIDAAGRKYEEDLQSGKEIQLSSLPPMNGPRDSMPVFDLNAHMNAAKEVGGDFYDYFYLEDGRLCLLMADVSGKGIPGALFMMKAKSIIHSQMTSKRSLEEVIRTVNDNLCLDNASSHFVTAFIAVVDLFTGRMEFVDAGHTTSVIQHGDGAVEWLKTKPDIFLGAFEDIDFNKYVYQLKPEDLLFLYTDGVTEAMNPEDVLFGEKRLEETMSQKTYQNAMEATEHVRRTVHLFSDGAEQNDDITIMSVKFRQHYMKTEAVTANLEQVTDFIEQVLTQYDFDMKDCTNMEIITEELFLNVADHAYKGQSGPFEMGICCDRDAGIVRMEFRDNGSPFNPLEHHLKEIPKDIMDLTVGGMGIRMVRSMTNRQSYKYLNNQNILAVTYDREKARQARQKR